MSSTSGPGEGAVYHVGDFSLCSCLLTARNSPFQGAQYGFESRQLHQFMSLMAHSSGTHGAEVLSMNQERCGEHPGVTPSCLWPEGNRDPDFESGMRRLDSYQGRQIHAPITQLDRVAAF
jgi:hypothetical protein